MKHLIGLTGPTGAGKGEACRVFDFHGFDVIDCDGVAHQATQAGSPLLVKLAAAFGEHILDEEGELIRPVLAQAAFSSEENTNLLNSIMLPYLTVLILQKAGEMKNDYVLLDAPTLFESGIDKMCECCIAVIADRDKRKERIISRDMLSEEEALLRINAQHDDAFYIEKCKYIVYNNDDIENLRLQIDKISLNIKEQNNI